MADNSTNQGINDATDAYLLFMQQHQASNSAFNPEKALTVLLEDDSEYQQHTANDTSSSGDGTASAQVVQQLQQQMQQQQQLLQQVANQQQQLLQQLANQQQIKTPNPNMLLVPAVVPPNNDSSGISRELISGSLNGSEGTEKSKIKELDLSELEFCGTCSPSGNNGISDHNAELLKKVKFVMPKKKLKGFTRGKAGTVALACPFCLLASRVCLVQKKLWGLVFPTSVNSITQQLYLMLRHIMECPNRGDQEFSVVSAGSDNRNGPDAVVKFMRKIGFWDDGGHIRYGKSEEGKEVA